MVQFSILAVSLSHWFQLMPWFVTVIVVVATHARVLEELHNCWADSPFDAS